MHQVFSDDECVMCDFMDLCFYNVPFFFFCVYVFGLGEIQPGTKERIIEIRVIHTYLLTFDAFCYFSFSSVQDDETNCVFCVYNTGRITFDCCPSLQSTEMGLVKSCVNAMMPNHG